VAGVLPDEGLVIATPDDHVVRLRADNTIDPSFSATILGGQREVVKAVLVQPDGKILLGGGFTNVNGMPRQFVARLMGIPAGPLLRNSRLNGKVYAADFFSEDGKTYQVEKTDAFGPSQWQILSPVIVGDGTVKSFTDASATGLGSYYRVRALF